VIIVVNMARDLEIPPHRTTDELAELETRHVQEPIKPRKKGYVESPLLMMGWIILWFMKNAIVLLIILLLLEYVIGPMLTNFIFSGCWETLPGADCS